MPRTEGIDCFRPQKISMVEIWRDESRDSAIGSGVCKIDPCSLCRKSAPPFQFSFRVSGFANLRFLFAYEVVPTRDP